MPRYTKGRVERSGGWIENEWFGPDPTPTPQLSVDDLEPADTGLIWATGEPIMRLPNPIGYGRDEDW